MGEYTAIHEAAKGVVELLQSKMTPAPISKPELIGLGAPFDASDFQLTVYLYQISNQPHRQNSPYGFQQEGKNTQRMAPLPVVLSLLITAHSKAPIQTRAADEYRILGRAIQVLRDNPMLTGDMLSGSLSSIEEPLHLTLDTEISIDQYNKLWSGTSKPYKLSVICQVDTVSIDSQRVKTVSRVKRVEINPKEKVR